MKRIITILSLMIMAVSTSYSLEPMKVGFVYTAGTPTNVQVKLADNTNSALFTGELLTTDITPNNSGVIIVNVKDFGASTAWANFQASSVNSYNTLDIYVNGTLYAQYRLDALILSQAQSSIYDNNGNFIPPTTNSTLGTDGNRWADAFISGNTLHIGPNDGFNDNEEMSLSYDDVTKTGSIKIDNQAVIFATETEVVIDGVPVGQGGGNISTNTVVGIDALASNITGSSNTAYGSGSLNNSLGDYNAGFGTNSLLNSTGGGNTALGQAAGASITSGSNNVFIGIDAGYDNSFQKVDPTNSIAIGSQTYTTADNQVVIGNGNITETQLAGTVIPRADNAQDLGSATNQWKDVYANGNLYLDGIGVSVTSSSISFGKPIDTHQTSETAYGISAAEGNTGSDVTAFGMQSAHGNTGNYVTASGLNSAIENTGNNVTSSGYNSVFRNSGDNVTAIGNYSAFQNTGNNVTSSGYNSAFQNTGNNVTSSGLNSALSNTGSDVTAFGMQSAIRNSGDNVTAIGNYSAFENTGNNVTSSGYNSAHGNSGDNVLSLGNDAGMSNGLSNVTILSNSVLPEYADRAAAELAITVANGAASSNTYLFYNATTKLIEAVRLP